MFGGHLDNLHIQLARAAKFEAPGSEFLQENWDAGFAMLIDPECCRCGKHWFTVVPSIVAVRGAHRKQHENGPAKLSGAPRVSFNARGI